MKATAPYITGMLFVSWHLVVQDTAAQRHEMATNQRASDQFVQPSSLPEALEVWKYPTGNRQP